MKSVSLCQRRGVRGQGKTRGSCVSEWVECEDLYAGLWDGILISMLMCYSVNVSAHTDKLFMKKMHQMTKHEVNVDVKVSTFLFNKVEK